MQKKEHNVIVTCPLCESKNLASKNLMLRNAYELFYCKSCDFKFCQPRPTLNFLIDYYNSLSSVRFFKHTDSKTIKDSEAIYKVIKKNKPEAKNILEIGCSTGYYIQGLKLRGYHVVGTELSNDAVNHAKNWYNLEIYNAEFPPSNYIEKFDVIIIHHVIEHVIDPKNFIKEADKYLSKNGILIIETPNYESLGVRIFKNHYPVFCPPGHLNFFQKSTIQTLLPSNHKVEKYKTSSASYQTVYNFITSILSKTNLKNSLNNVISEKIEVNDKNDIEKKIVTNKKFKYLSAFYMVSKVMQILLFPFFYILDKSGLGDNLSVVSKKTG